MRATNATSVLTTSWTSVGACMVIAAVSQGLFISCFPLWVVPWIDDFHVKRGTATSGFAIGNLIMGLASPVVGICIERFPARLSIALGGAVLAIGFALSSLVTSFWQLVALYASLLACGAAFTGVLPTKSVAVRIFPDKVGTASGAITVAAASGGIIFPALLTAPLTALGWRYTFVLMAAIVVLTIVPCAWFVLRRCDEGNTEAVAMLDSVSISEILRMPAFWVPLMGVVPAMFTMGAVLANAVAIAGDSGIALGVAGYLVSTIPAGGMIGSLGLGWLCDRIDYRRIFAVASAAAMLALLLLRDRIGPLPMGLAFGIIGVVVGAAFPVVAVMLVRSFGPQRFPRFMGLMMPPMIVAMAVGPVVAGWVRDRTGSYSIIFDVCAALMFLCGAEILALGVHPKLRQQSQE